MPLPAFSLVLTTLIINLRHLLMGVALHPWLARLSRPQCVAALFYLNDEAWALSMRELETGGNDVGFLFGANLTTVAAWVAATATGHAGNFDTLNYCSIILLWLLKMLFMML
jgi:predicted branched-subunit amino acid permease